MATAWQIEQQSRESARQAAVEAYKARIRGGRLLGVTDTLLVEVAAQAFYNGMLLQSILHSVEAQEDQRG